MRTWIILALVGIAFAAGTPGALDSTFDGDGLVVTPPTGGLPDDWASFESVAVQTDGKVVVAGLEEGAGPGEFVVARYNVDGSLDASFGTDETGFVKPFVGESRSFASSVVLDPSDGSILVFGDAMVEREIGGRKKKKTQLVPVLALVRLDADGILDDTFGEGGKALVDIAGTARGMALQTDGKIVALAETTVSRGKRRNRVSSEALVLVRYEADGTPDLLFGTNGIVVDDITDRDEVAGDVGLQSDGMIVVVATDKTINFNFLRRYETDGDVDTAFGTDGGRETFEGSNPNDGRHRIAIDDDDRILVASSAGGDGILVRYDVDGTKDEDFAYATGLPENDRLRGVFLLADGRIVACGETLGAENDGFVLRLTPDGDLDTTYGISDFTTPGDGVAEYIRGCAVDPDGNYVICGTKWGDYLLARYCK